MGRSVLLGVMGLVWLASAGGALAQEAVPPAGKTEQSAGAGPQAEAGGLAVEALEARRAAVAEDEALAEAERAEVLELYGQAIERLEAAASFREEAAAYRKRFEAAPGETEAAQRELARLAARPPVTLPEEVPGDAGLDVYERLLSQARARLASEKAERDRFAAETERERNRLGEISAELKAAEESLKRIDEALEAVPEAEPETLAEAREAALRARKQARLAEIEKLRQEQLSHEVRMKWREAELALREARLARGEAEVALYQQEVDRLGKIEAQRRLSAARQAVVEAGEDPVLRPIAETNLELAEALIENARRRVKRGEQLEQLERELEQLERSFEQARSKLDTLGMTEVLGRTLQSQRQTLLETVRRLGDTGGLSGRLEELLVRQFDVDARLARLQDLEAAARRRLAEHGAAGAGDEQRLEEVRSALAAQRDALEAMEKALAANITLINEIDANRREFEEKARAFEGFLDERLIWTPNARPVSYGTLEELWEGVRWFANPSEWQGAGRALGSGVRSRPIVSILLLAGLAVLLVFRPRMKTALRVIAGRVGLPYADRFRLTPEALAWTALLAAPGPLFFAGAGGLLREAADPFTVSLGAGLQGAGGVWYLLAFVRGLCRENGAGGVHFRWREAARVRVRRQLAWALPVLVVGTLVLGTTRTFPEDPDDLYWVGLGRLMLVVNMLVVAAVVFRVFHPRGEVMGPALLRAPGRWLYRLRWFWFSAGVGLPICLAVLALSGYLYSAAYLRGKFIATACLVIVSLVAHATILRWQILAHIRLVIAEAREKRAMEEEGVSEGTVETPEGAEIAVDDPAVDLAAINENTRQLIRMIIGAGVILGLWLIWADVIQAFSVLDRVTVGGFTVNRVDAEGNIVQAPLTLDNVVASIVVLCLTVLAVKNLPGMIEAAVLQRLSMEPGARYAWSAILQYVLVGLGVVLVAQSVGLDWSSVQWLVAALGVGLGFGLQEIFANFISGLIILFERPIRVGDTVTIGQINGTVSRIRMRATTIVDWDLKELVVPNKEFITGQLVNWSLSDPILRWTIPVGVAYGSDTAKAHELLLAEAQRHPEVLDDPPPQALFLGFGDSALDFELRVFLPNIAVAIKVRHELHMAIDEAFRRAGITIAFPQRDVHLDSLKPIEVTMVPSPG